MRTILAYLYFIRTYSIYNVFSKDFHDFLLETWHHFTGLMLLQKAWKTNNFDKNISGQKLTKIKKNLNLKLKQIK